MLWTYPIPQSTLWPLNSCKRFRYHLHQEHWVDIPYMATANRKHQMWHCLAGYFQSRCFLWYFLWQLYSKECFGSAMVIDFSKKVAYWLLFCYEETGSNWTLAELEKKQEDLQLMIIIKVITAMVELEDTFYNHTQRMAYCTSSTCNHVPVLIKLCVNHTICLKYVSRV